MNWDLIFTESEACDFVRRYRPRLYATTFGNTEQLPVNGNYIKIRKSDWKYFLCHVSHKEYSCGGGKSRRPMQIGIEYDKDTMTRLYPSLEQNELLDILKSNYDVLILFECSDGVNALSFITECTESGGRETSDDDESI